MSDTILADRVMLALFNRRMEGVLRENDRLKRQVRELQVCLENGEKVIRDSHTSREEADRYVNAAECLRIIKSYPMRQENFPCMHPLACFAT